jgi:glycosyltransferase involved in cell wall biosynthesis
VVEHEHNGFLVTPGSEQEICAAAVRLHTNPELWNHMSIEARRTYEQLYMPETNGRALLDIYKSTLKKNKQLIHAEA